MAGFTLHNGDPLMIDHTPGSAMAAGEGVLINAKVYIAHRAIAAGGLGALAAPSGKAVYKLAKAGGGGVTFAAGANVQFDAANQLGIAGATDHGLRAVAAAADADTFVLVQHGT